MNGVEKPDPTALLGLVNKFKRDICELDLSVAVQKHLTYGPCCLLSSDAYFELKREIAQQFKLHPTQVLVVGSAKLGFSIVPKKRYRLFNDESDIDVALVAPQLFEEVWTEVYDYWYGSAYWDQHQTFCNYLFQGWIRLTSCRRSTVLPNGGSISGNLLAPLATVLTKSARGRARASMNYNGLFS